MVKERNLEQGKFLPVTTGLVKFDPPFQVTHETALNRSSDKKFLYSVIGGVIDQYKCCEKIFGIGPVPCVFNMLKTLCQPASRRLSIISLDVPQNLFCRKIYTEYLFVCRGWWV